MAEKTFTEALLETLYQQMSSTPEISVIGSAYLLGPGIKSSALDRVRGEFADRLIDEPPIAEAAIASLGFGAAMAGGRPFVHFGRASFAYEAWSQIINEAGVVHHMTGGQITVPVVMHMFHGLSPMETAQHCHSPQAMFWNSPGLEIVLPSTPGDMKGLLKTAFESDNPTIILNHQKLMGLREEVPDDDYAIPFGQADIKREGKDVTVVATSLMVQVALEAAEVLAQNGIDTEVFDPRTLVPFDREALLTSVRKTGRLVVVDETHLSCGVGAEISAIVAEAAFSSLRAPIIRVARPDVPVPYGAESQQPFAPSVDQVVEAVQRVLA